MRLNKIDCLANYSVVKYKNLICYYKGFIYKAGLKSGKESIEELLKEYESTHILNLKGFYGSYRVVIEDTIKDMTIFFGDNAGSCCFYYDESSGTLSDSFLQVIKHSRILLPNYEAITEFLSFSCIYGEETICSGVFRTNPLKYYLLEKNKIVEKEKDFIKLEENHRYANLHEFMIDLVHASAEIAKAVVITGGTDSRTILSHLVSRQIDFNLIISGGEDTADVKIARTISSKLEKKLYVSHVKTENLDESEIRRLFLRTDGVFGFYSRLRLHQKSNMLEKLGVGIEIGGVGGELYKNSFLNQDFPFLCTGSVNKERFYKLKIRPYYLDPHFFTEVIENSKNKMKNRVLRKLFSDSSAPKYQTYFKAGIRAIQYRMITLTNSSSFTIPIISPFTEIDVMSLPFNDNPWKLELNQWQRREVSAYCHQIAQIKTDRGLSLKDSKISLIKDFLSTYSFLIKVGLSRILVKKRNVTPGSLVGFDMLREKEFFTKAIYKCKELNILREDVHVDGISDELADRLLTIGMVFSENESNGKYTEPAKY